MNLIVRFILLIGKLFGDVALVLAMRTELNHIAERLLLILLEARVYHIWLMSDNIERLACGIVQIGTAYRNGSWVGHFCRIYSGEAMIERVASSALVIPLD